MRELGSKKWTWCLGLQLPLSEGKRVLCHNMPYNVCSMIWYLQPQQDVMAHVEKGYRMESPDGCPPEVYAIMKECWEMDPQRRPDFRQLLPKIEQIKASTPTVWLHIDSLPTLKQCCLFVNYQAICFHYVPWTPALTSDSQIHTVSRLELHLQSTWLR